MKIHPLLLLFVSQLAFWGCNSASSPLDPDGGSDSDTDTDTDTDSDADTDECLFPPDWEVEATPDELQDHCEQVVEEECARAFADCPDLWLYTYEYNDLADCQSSAPGDVCTPKESWNHSFVEAATSDACIAAIQVAQCDEFNSEGGVAECDKMTVEIPVPPLPATCQDMGEGEHDINLDLESPFIWGNHVHAGCFCLVEGQNFKYEIKDTTIDEPVLHFIDPLGHILVDTWTTTYSTYYPSITMEIEQSGTYVVIIGDETAATPSTGADVEVTIE